MGEVVNIDAHRPALMFVTPFGMRLMPEHLLNDLAEGKASITDLSDADGVLRDLACIAMGAVDER